MIRSLVNYAIRTNQTDDYSSPGMLPKGRWYPRQGTHFLQANNRNSIFSFGARPVLNLGHKKTVKSCPIVLGRPLKSEAWIALREGRHCQSRIDTTLASMAALCGCRMFPRQEQVLVSSVGRFRRTHSWSPLTDHLPPPYSVEQSGRWLQVGRPGNFDLL